MSTTSDPACPRNAPPGMKQGRIYRHSIPRTPGFDISFSSSINFDNPTRHHPFFLCFYLALWSRVILDFVLCLYLVLWSLLILNISFVLWFLLRILCSPRFYARLVHFPSPFPPRRQVIGTHPHQLLTGGLSSDRRQGNSNLM
jgi:hypothetical protein